MEAFAALRAVDPEQVGPYRLVARLGSGGMGSVYLGRSPGGRTVAVKVVRPDLAEEPGFQHRFAREVAAARRMNGASTAGLVDADPVGVPPWPATEYVRGLALGAAVEAHGPWPVSHVLRLGAGLAEALSRIHAAVSSLMEQNTLRALDPKSGEVIWKRHLADDCLTRPVTADGTVYVVGDGVLYALRADTGATVRQYATKTSFHPAPLVVGDTVCLSSDTGRICAVRARRPERRAPTQLSPTSQARRRGQVLRWLALPMEASRRC